MKSTGPNVAGRRLILLAIYPAYKSPAWRQMRLSPRHPTDNGDTIGRIVSKHEKSRGGDPIEQEGRVSGEMESTLGILLSELIEAMGRTREIKK